MIVTEAYSFVVQLFGHNIVQVLSTIAIAVVIQLIVRATVDRVVRRAVRHHRYHSKIDEEKRERTLSTIFHTASAVVIWIIAIIVILWQLDVNIAALMTGAGLVGIIVGFGAQNAIKDFLAGIFVITENQYRVGDIVTLHAEGTERSGIVEDITVRITRIRDLDGNVHIIRNGSVGVVTNLSFEHANVNIDVRVAYDTDIEKLEKVVNEVGQTLAEDETWSDRILEPIQFLYVNNFEESAIQIKCLGKVRPAEQWDVAGEFRGRLLTAFKKNNITIPFPQVTIHDTKTKKA